MCLCVLQDLDPYYTGNWSWPLSWGCSSLFMPHPLVWSSDRIPQGLRVWAFHLFLLPYGTWAAPRIRKFQPWRKHVEISNHFRSFSRNILLPVPLLITLVFAMVWVQSVLLWPKFPNCPTELSHAFLRGEKSLGEDDPGQQKPHAQSLIFPNSKSTKHCLFPGLNWWLFGRYK